MELPECRTLKIELDAGCLLVTLNRPEVRNALNMTMVNELVSVFSAVQDDMTIRAVVLEGAGEDFCAGGDIQDLSSGLTSDEGERGPLYQMNLRFGALLALAARIPQVLVVRASGSILGGGVGLVCVSDFAIATRDASFGLPETGLGIPPSQVMPFLVGRVGLTNARAIALIGNRFSGLEAREMGLVSQLCATRGELERFTERVIRQIKTRAPGATAVTKSLLLSVGNNPMPALLERGAVAFSECLRGPEGREGAAAFLEKRLPGWVTD
jgi:isohexenylglutaconyl-CoA hydratase